MINDDKEIKTFSQYFVSCARIQIILPTVVMNINYRPALNSVMSCQSLCLFV